MEEKLFVCEWCGKEFLAKRTSARFCSTACRVAHHREKERFAESYKQKYDDQTELPADVSISDLAEATIEVRSAAALFSAGAMTGPPKLRELCSRVGTKLLSALESEGL